MKRAIFFTILIGLLTACASKKSTINTEADTNNASSNTTTEHQIMFQDVQPGDSLFASIEKTYCFGKCPVFSFHIYNSGYAVYTGTANVNLMGRHTTRLTKEQMIYLIDKANEINYFELKDVYDNEGITDLPSTTTSIVINGERKSVKKRYDFPRSIVIFETAFEELIKRLRWNPGLATE